MKTLTLIDGSGFIFRAYHSLPPLTNPAGTPVGAVYGFINMLIKYMEGTKTDAILVVFDAARYNFRNRLYEKYKANREAPPEDLVPQFALTREAAKALGLPIAEVADVEADDVIASYARAAKAAGMQVTIVSSDKDLMQLIEEGITMYDPMKQRVIGREQVIEKFGVPPEKVVEVLSLIGDSSDNVPGVPGIGPKTAAELILQYSDLENLLAHASEIKQPKRRETLIENAENARLSHMLVTLKEDVPLPLTLEALACKSPDPNVLCGFLETHGFRSLLMRLKEKFGIAAVSNITTPVYGGNKGGKTNSAIDVNVPPLTSPLQAGGIVSYECVQTEAALLEWLKKIERMGRVVVDVETNMLNPMQAALVGVSLSVEKGKACYIPVGHTEKGNGEKIAEGDLFAAAHQPKLLEGQLPHHLVVTMLKPMLENPGILKIGHNIKYDAMIFRHLGIHLAPMEDTMLMSYALYAGLHPHNMDALAEQYLQHKTITYDEVTGTGKARISFAEVALDKACAYAAEDADITMRFYLQFAPLLHHFGVETLYRTIEKPLVDVVVAMEARGILVDKTKLNALSHQFETEMQRLEKQIHAEAGMTFNIGSPKQLGEILFDKLQLPGGKKSSKTGAYSTDNQTLEELAEQGIELARHVIEWREMAKLKSTYTDALVTQINPNTGRVHTSYALAATSTGRLSSSDPNLQNIPIRSELGRQIRTAFVAKPGFQLISADYSQIELRLLAHIADIPSLKQAFKESRDIHATTASDMFSMPMEAVTPEARRSAKMINFGIIYGMSAHGLAVRLGIPRGEAASYIEKYFERYPGIKAYMERTKEFARTHGFVTTLYGRRCHLPAIHDKNPARRQFSERAAINAPLQGTAADIIKIAMIRVERMLNAQFPEAAMLLSVHDELVIEAPQARVTEIMQAVKREMEHVARLSVPLIVETRAGANWGEAH